MNISVIMPSYLGEFPGCAPNRPQKFIRAVDSFLSQNHKDKELIIIADGCPDTEKICHNRYKQALVNNTIRLISLPHYGFQGLTRQAGIDLSKGEILCNLDSDDTFLPYHLSNIDLNFKKNDWVYFNHYTQPDNIKDVAYWYDCQLEEGKICNANYAWKKELNVTWIGGDGRQDNKFFTKQLIEKYTNRTKIYGCGYVVKHIQIEEVK